MQTLTARIPVRSHRQAMDWSLVLVSQGIETALERSETGQGWGLLVAPQEYGKALATLRQYKLENRRWSWRREVFRPSLLFDWASLAWLLLVVFFYWLNRRLDLRPAGLMDSQAVAHGQWWRLFTATWLHADPGHLGTNAALGFVLLGLTLGRYGTGPGLLAAYLAGAGGNVMAWLLAEEPHRSLGASGLVMGCLGLLAAQSFARWGELPHARKYILTGIAAGLMLFVLLGLTPGTDVLAHLGGFLSGLLLGALLLLAGNSLQRPVANLASGFLFALLVIVPWWLALTRPEFRF